MALKPHPQPAPKPEAAAIRHRLHTIIFEADTPGGKLFDVALILAILLSVLIVMLDSVPSLDARYGNLFFLIEWGFTLLFTAEYLLRLACLGRPARYARSFYGVVDLLSILPTYLSLIFPGSQYLLSIRVLRILRVFRVLKLVQYVGEADHLMRALRSSRHKIIVFLFGVATLVIIFGSLIYLLEGPENGFTSLFDAYYYAIVTLSTVGYGDITPQTGPGKALSCLIMILGYGIIAVPTGIVSVELAQAKRLEISTQSCPECGIEGHVPDARFCRECGARL